MRIRIASNNVALLFVCPSLFTLPTTMVSAHNNATAAPPQAVGVIPRPWASARSFAARVAAAAPCQRPELSPPSPRAHHHTEALPDPSR